MKAMVLDVDERLLDERRRKGLDVFDEMWDGVLHMVPPPSERHQRLGSWLLEILAPLARRQDLMLTLGRTAFSGHVD